MRYYNVAITDPTSGKDFPFKSLGGLQLTSLLTNGNPNPAALNIELDAVEYNYATPDQNSTWLRVWGLGLQDLASSFDLNGKNIKLSVGMSRGLPLANPAQQGLIINGQIFQAFGNWIGTEQTLDINIGPATGSPANPTNFTFYWKAGTPLSTALAQTLSTALPNFKQRIQISPNLVVGADETGYYQSLGQLAQWVNARTKPILGGSYGGVQITSDGDTVNVWDSATKPSNDPIAINPQDLLGQPTWFAPATISVKVVMRGDLNIGDLITLPQTLITTQGNAFSRFSDQSTFNGTFQILQMHHYGNFRQPDAMSWNTTLQVTPQTGS